jgi:hypothetical protein
VSTGSLPCQRVLAVPVPRSAGLKRCWWHGNLQIGRNNGNAMRDIPQTGLRRAGMGDIIKPEPGFDRLKVSLLVLSAAQCSTAPYSKISHIHLLCKP